VKARGSFTQAPPICDIQRNESRFSRRGYNYAYHLGDLSGAAANREAMVIAHIESERAMKNVDALLAVGIDAYHLGPEGVRTALAFQDKPRIPASSRSWRRQSAEFQRGRTAECMASAARPLSNIRGEHA